MQKPVNVNTMWAWIAFEQLKSKEQMQVHRRELKNTEFACIILPLYIRDRTCCHTNTLRCEFTPQCVCVTACSTGNIQNLCALQTWTEKNIMIKPTLYSTLCNSFNELYALYSHVMFNCYMYIELLKAPLKLMHLETCIHVCFNGHWFLKCYILCTLISFS